MKLALIKKLGFWLGWLFLAMALASLVWSVLLWRYPLPVAEKSTPTNQLASQAIGLKGLEKHWLVGEQKAPQRVETNEPIQVSRLAVKVQGILFSNQAVTMSKHASIFDTVTSLLKDSKHQAWSLTLLGYLSK